jgi:hypothetical protein
MNHAIERINRKARINVIGHSRRFVFYLSEFYPCSSVCIRGSKELSDHLK